MTYKNIDPSNMYQSIYNFPDHMVKAIRIGTEISLKNSYPDIRNIIVAGMGGSAIGGDVVRLLTKNMLKVPMLISRNYTLPYWVDKHTLVICSSYSGNTEESLSAFRHAREKGATIVGVSTGGELTDLMNKAGLDLVLIPPGLQPRAALAFSFIPMLYLLYEIGLINGAFIPDLEETIELLNEKRITYSKESPINPAYILAEKIYNTLPIIYGETESTGIIAVRWKGQLSENAKMLAYCNDLPELDHNEIVGWENNPQIMKNISLIWLKDRDEHARVSMRRDSTHDIIGDFAGAHETVSVSGKTSLERYLHLIQLGDWLSYWCAILHETDPTPVHNIDRLKSILAANKI